MSLRFLAIGTVLACAAAAASSDASRSLLSGMHPAAAGGQAHLYAVGTRSAAQRQSSTAAKMDSVLADLSRHAAKARAGHVLSDLHSLSPAARFRQTTVNGKPLVLIDATTRRDPQELESALVSLGLERPAVYLNDVGGWLPVEKIETAAARSEVLSIRAAMPRRRAGAVTSQGDFAQRSSVVRTNYPTLDGSGITVGVISDSFNCYAVYAAPGSGVPVSGNQGYAPNGFTADYATDVSTGDLPASVNVLEEADCMNYGAPTQLPFTDEGRAMLQIVHDVAPGASLAFYTAENSEADFSSGVGRLAAAGAKVIADDVGYFDEPYFQDGLVARAIDAVEAQGVAYFSAAGNNGSLSYETTAPSFTTVSSSGPNAGEHLLNFDPTGATNTVSLPVTVPPIPPGDFLAVVVEWDQPYVTGAPGSPGASSSVDLCITGGTGSDVITDYDGNAASCTGPNAVGSDSYQIMIIGNPANAAGNSAQQNFNITVGLAANSKGTILPGRVIVSVEDDGLGSAITRFATNSATLQGHPGAAGAAAVGAALYFDTPQCGTTPAQIEPYSSIGGAPILFDISGVRLATPIIRQKPDFVGPDGGNDTFLGFTLASGGYTGTNGLWNTTIAACQNDPNYPNFFGTSAATPHAAGIAALMLKANAAATPAQIYSSLRQSALAMSEPSPNFTSGYGFLRADSALVVPTLTLAAPSVVLGGTTTLNWSSIYATGCTASGAWSGAEATSGSVIVQPTVLGTATYTLTCSNAFGTAAAASTTLTVTSGLAVPPAPILSLSPATVAVGGYAALTWSSTNATACTASGSWKGGVTLSGSEKITPTTVGLETFTLVCSNSGGTSAPKSVTLEVTPPAVKPAAPALALGSTSIPADTTTTITWSSPNASTCTATSNAGAARTGWFGTLTPSGTYSLTPTETGTDVFSLTCQNSAGVSPTSSVSLTVTDSANTKGGGGLDSLALFGLAALTLARTLRARTAL